MSRILAVSLLSIMTMGFWTSRSDGAPPNPASNQQQRLMAIAQGKKLYEQKCASCHQLKPVESKTLKAWNTLIYSSGCSDVTIPLKIEERKLLQAYISSLAK